MRFYDYGIINEDFDNDEEIIEEGRINVGNGNYIIKAPSLDMYDGNENEDNY